MSKLETIVPGLFRAKGEAVRYVADGKWHPIARVANPRTREDIAAQLADAATHYPELIDVLYEAIEELEENHSCHE